MRKLAALSTACAALLVVSIAAGQTGITNRLTLSGVAVRVTSEPAGTTSIRVGVMKNLAGLGRKSLSIPASQLRYTPPPETPVVEMRAYGSSGPIGGWTPPLKTVPPSEAPKEEPPKEEPPKEEAPREGSGSMIVGVDSGGWAGSSFTDLASGGIHYTRTGSSHGSLIGEASQAGVHVASVIFGEGGTIGAINPTAYANEIVSYFTKYGRAGGLAVELLNEADNSMFWSDAGNTAAYAKLAKAVHEGLATLPASSRPAELCNWDGGSGPNSTWGGKLKATGALAFCDGVTVHPYGGSSGQDGGALGGRQDVEGAHSGSGLPVYITEVGWPTATGEPSTGDSQQWTEAQQATNVTRFMTWAHGTGYVSMVIYFNYVDYGTNAFYGIETKGRVHKPSFAALAEAATRYG
jgi:hypothetical protein